LDVFFLEKIFAGFSVKKGLLWINFVFQKENLYALWRAASGAPCPRALPQWTFNVKVLEVFKNLVYHAWG